MSVVVDMSDYRFIALTYLEPVHQETEEGHKFCQFCSLELGHNSRNKLRDELGHGRTYGIDKLRE